MSSPWFWVPALAVATCLVIRALTILPLHVAIPAWTLQSKDGNIAFLHTVSDEPEHVRLEVMRAVSENPWDLAFGRHLAVAGDRSYVLSFEGRADQALPLDVNLREFHPPWDNLGFFREVELNTEWQSFHYTFDSNGQTENAFVAFQIGRHPTNVEIRNLRLTPSIVAESATR